MFAGGKSQVASQLAQLYLLPATCDLQTCLGDFASLREIIVRIGAGRQPLI